MINLVLTIVKTKIIIKFVCRYLGMKPILFATRSRNTLKMFRNTNSKHYICFNIVLEKKLEHTK